MGGQSETQLVEKLAKCDPDAIAVAYDLYGRIAFSLFVRITRDQSAAEDLVQELFLRLWNRRREFDAQPRSSRTLVAFDCS